MHCPTISTFKALAKFFTQFLILIIFFLSSFFLIFLAANLTRPTQGVTMSTLVVDFGITSPYHNYIYQIINHPQNPNLWLVVSESGVFKSENAGENFNSIAPLSSRVAWHPFDPQVIFSAWDNELKKTSDGGQNWQAIPKPGGTVLRVYVDQKNPNLVYYSNRTGRCDWDPWCKIYQSTDAGVNFSPIADYAAENLYVSPYTSKIYFAASVKEDEQTPYVFFQSSDFGVSWTKTYPHLNGIEPQEVITQIQQDTKDQLWVVTLNPTNHNAPGQIYRSLDQGATWENKSMGLSSAWLIRAFLIDEQNPAALYVSFWDGGIFKSVDEGSTWQKILDVREIPALHPPHEAFSLFKFEGFLYFGTDQGQIFKIEEGPAPQHPVIFVHGLGGYPSNWEEGGSTDIYFKTLKAPPYNYPPEFLHAYTYSDTDGNSQTYDNQGDIVLISQGLKDDMDRLAELYYPGCEVDCVDLVGYSLGGIVIRQYLNDHQFDHKVRKAITIASPHRGAWMLQAENYFNVVPVFGEQMRTALNDAINTLLRSFGEGLDLNSQATTQVTPNSDFLRTLNSISLDLPSYKTLSGRIDAEISQKIFFYEIRKGFDIGDIYILPDSAIGIPTNNLQIFEFSDPDKLRFEFKPAMFAPGIYKLTLDILSPDDFQYSHRRLITHSQVVNRVTYLLTNE